MPLQPRQLPPTPVAGPPSLLKEEFVEGVPPPQLERREPQAEDDLLDPLQVDVPRAVEVRHQPEVLHPVRRERPDAQLRLLAEHARRLQEAQLPVHPVEGHQEQQVHRVREQLPQDHARPLAPLVLQRWHPHREHVRLDQRHEVPPRLDQLQPLQLDAQLRDPILQLRVPLLQLQRPRKRQRFVRRELRQPRPLLGLKPPPLWPRRQ